MSDAFGIICEREHHHDPLDPKTEWRDRNSEGGDTLTTSQVENYSLPRPGSVYRSPSHKWGLDSSALSRMFIASAVALTLQWGTTGGALIIVWFTSAQFGEYIVALSSFIDYLVLNPSLLRSRLPVGVIHRLWRTLYSRLDDASYVQYPNILFHQRSYPLNSGTSHPGAPGSGRWLAFHLPLSFSKANSRIKCCMDRCHWVFPVQLLL